MGFRPLIAAFVLATACQGSSVDDTGSATPTPSDTGETMTAEDCTDGLDNDGDTLIDCADRQCDDECEEHCADDVDNNGDGLIDCADVRCAGIFPCDQERDCDDGIDDDIDGLLDCEDADCVRVPTCDAETECADGIDNDMDGAADCADGDCVGSGCAGFASRVTSGAGAAWDVHRTREYDACTSVAHYRHFGGWNIEARDIEGTVQALDSAGAATATCQWGYAEALHVGRFEYQYNVGGALVVYSFEFDPVQRSGFFVDPGCGTSGSAFLPNLLHPTASAIAITRVGLLEEAEIVHGLWFDGVDWNHRSSSGHEQGTCGWTDTSQVGASMVLVEGVDSYRAGTPAP